jgi:uncharacterized protein
MLPRYFFGSLLLLPVVLLASDVVGWEQHDSPLADAAEHGRWTRVGELLDAAADVEAAQADGMTALLWAAYHSDASVARRLLEAGADPNRANHFGITPLSLACLNGDQELVEQFLAAGADPEATLPGGETPLMTAARTGRIGSVRALLARDVAVDAQEKNGQTALMWAAAEGHVEVVDALLAAGADSRKPLATGFTPLFFAVREGRIEVVLRLLAAGHDVNQVMEPTRRIRKGPTAGISPLILAAENGHFDLAAALLEAGADPNDLRSGYSPLHTLTWVRKPKRGDDEDGDPSPIGSGHRTSLQLVRDLVQAGADPNLRLERGPAGRGRLSKVGATPFLMACETADLPLMKLLVELGADASIPNVDNCTPLMAAAGIGQDGRGEEAGTEEEAYAAVEYLIALGADVNAVDDQGQTAMHGAAYKSAPSIVRLLARHGAEVAVWNRENQFGWTPLHLAHGYRPGNFKPSQETIAALHEVLRAAGLAVPKAIAPPPGSDPYEEGR